MLFPDILRHILRLTFADEHEPQVSELNWLASCATISSDWYRPAQELLWSNISIPLCRYEGYFAPAIVRTVRNKRLLGTLVKELHITSSLEGALWLGRYFSEGDVFADLVDLMPNLQRITVPDFEVVCRDRILSSLGSLSCLRSFNIRVYLQSKRRDPAFHAIFQWFEWDMPTLARLMASRPSLREFTVAHQPIDCYHIKPDPVCAPNTSREALPSHRASLTSLSLRETFIDDAGLFYLLQNSPLRQLSILSCEGITSSAITKSGLLQALKLVGPTVENLTVMTSWPESPFESTTLVLDEAVKHLQVVKNLTLAGHDVSDAFLDNLQPQVRLNKLGVTDFELVTPLAISKALRVAPQLQDTSHLTIFLRNGASNSRQSTTGWNWAQGSADVLAQVVREKGIRVTSLWETALLSGALIKSIEQA